LNHKETLFFIAKCLTISFEEKNRQEIEKLLELGNIDWKAVVKLSTSHLVFPALYCNLNRANFLKYLPSDLVEYMKHITNLNRDRNKQIITQAQELNKLLLANNITPIFLKGTGNLFAGIYEDIGERMVGDIDFIFSKEEYTKAIIVLKNNGYSFTTKIPYEYYFKHYPRLKNQDRIAAIEIHKEFILRKYAKEFNYTLVNEDIQVVKGISILSYANKLNLSIIANQINDEGFYYKTINLRNAYDVFLLSKKTNAKFAVNSLEKLNYPLNCFLAACYEVFNRVESLEYNNTKKSNSYLKVFNSQLINIRKTKRKHKCIKIYLLIKKIFNIVFKAIIYKDYRVWLFKMLRDKNYSMEKLIQMLKK